MWKCKAIAATERRNRLGDATQSAVGDSDRMVVTSCVIHEVPEGQWAQNGAIRRLPETVALVGFDHLVSLG